MRVVICAIAKKENAYLNDWARYHLNLGVDEIYVYDNNDPDYESVEGTIDKDIIEKVHFIDAKGKKYYQIKAYNEFYKENKSNFDWCAFIDIDEFITLPENVKDIKIFLDHLPYSVMDADAVLLPWKIYGDNDEIEQPMDKPIYERITKEAILEGRRQRRVIPVKSIIRGGLPFDDIFGGHMHVMKEGKSKTMTGYLNDIKTYFVSVSSVDYNLGYIRHYQTKTLKEFLDYKLDRSDAEYEHSNIDIGYFFSINQETKEKKEYIERYMKERK